MLTYSITIMNVHCCTDVAEQHLPRSMSRVFLGVDKNYTLSQRWLNVGQRRWANIKPALDLCYCKPIVFAGLAVNTLYR